MFRHTRPDARALSKLRQLVFAAAGLAFLFAVGAGTTEASEVIEYRVDFSGRASHYIDVTATFPSVGEPHNEVMLAVWTPGSYLVREYQRHLEELTASTVAVGKEASAELPIEKVAKNRWRIETKGARRFQVDYRVYCREMSVRTNWVEADFAFLNGAPTFLTLPDGVARPHKVTFALPKEWQHCVTGLTKIDAKAHEYEARNFDELVDCPVLLGNLDIKSFDVDGVPHFLANQGGGEFWDSERAAEDVQKIVQEQIRFWGSIPYKHYSFLNAIVEGGGGLEHSNSTLMLTSRWSFRDPKRYRGWLGLVSHEFFHTWNVKRLRPIELGPFDYEEEQLTHSLWIVEGITSYYDDLLVKRAGLLTEKQYLENLSKSIGALQVTPGRLVQPLRTSSYDAWIKYYRKDENSDNTSISYYTKGAIVGFLLDVAIRRATNDRRSLDDVMRSAYERFSGERGYTQQEFRAVASEVAGVDLSSWFAHACDTTEELDYAPALEWYGLRFKDPKKKKKKDKERAEKATNGDDDEEDDEEEEKRIAGWIGLSTKSDNGTLTVSRVKRGTPAHTAGLNVGDEIIALDGYRIRSNQWSSRRKQYSPGDKATLLVARRGLLLELGIEFAKEPPKKWQLEVDPNAAESQKSRRLNWLAPSGT